MLEAFISDVHFPFEDKRAWELALKLIHAAQPDLVWIGGDFIDCYAVSSFSRDPKRVVNFQEEIDAAIGGLKEVRQAAPQAHIKYNVEANHEIRLLHALRAQPAFSSIRALAMPKLLEFDRFNILAVYGKCKVGRLWHIHGHEVGGGSVFPARTVYNKLQANLIMGHYHKAQVHYNTLLDDTSHVSICNPCLCELDQEYIKGKAQWQQGLTFIEYLDNGDFHDDGIVFFRSSKKRRLNAMWRGKSYVA
jgi:UDP-2,3-diacylglucosamine pyrophosphatase LpxH